MGQATAVADDAARSGQGTDAVARPDQEGRRILALDGVRGTMTLLVLLSHFFAEVPHGIDALMLGWIAVDMFFVQSGFLIGKLVLDKKEHTNFFRVFYLRRFFRLIPIYIGVVLVTTALIRLIDRPWVDADHAFPLWSYLTFTQTAYMVSSGSIGAHWLAPTWTLAVEEHFYLVVPALLVFTPERWLVRVLVGGVLAAVSLRVAIFAFGVPNEMAAFVLLPGRADLLLCGILAAVAIRSPDVPWARIERALRVVPLGALLAVLGLKLWDDRLFHIWNPLILGIGCAAFLLSIVRNAPEAERFKGRTLRFFGDTGYVVYLAHLPILGLMHGLLLGAKPDIATSAQWLVTIAALPVVILVGWAVTRFVEEPLTRFGRGFRWSDARRG